MRIDQGRLLIQKINRFLYAPAYFLLIGGLTVLSNTCGAELFVYTCFVLIAMFVCLFGRDLLPLMPMFVCGYISPSVENNPGFNADSVFSFAGGGWYLILLIAGVLACLVYRLITDPDFGGKKFFARKRGLLSGMLILGGSYLLSGLGSQQLQNVFGQNLVFSLLQILSVAGLYYLFSGAVRWELAPKAYLSWTGVCVGYVLLAELLFIYADANVIVDGTILRERIYTGWGHYNNIGVLLAMMIPCPFFLTGKGRKTGAFYISGMLFLAGLIFTCSRGSIICGVVVYMLSYLVSLFHSRYARANVAIHVFTALVAILAFAVFYGKITRLFSSLIQIGLDPSNRFEIYHEGLKQFFKYPVFGETFFPSEYIPYSWSTAEGFTAFFPPRWHNTVIQLLASCGVVGMVAYAVHRVQTVCLFVRNYSGKKIFFALSILVLLSASMLDCHMFNIGPVLFYSMTLAFTEQRLNMTPRKKAEKVEI